MENKNKNQITPCDLLMMKLREYVPRRKSVMKGLKKYGVVRGFDPFSEETIDTEQGPVLIRLLCSPQSSLSYDGRVQLFNRIVSENAAIFRKFTDLAPVRGVTMRLQTFWYRYKRDPAALVYALGNVTGSEFEVGERKLIAYLPNGAYFGFNNNAVVSAIPLALEGKLVGDFSPTNFIESEQAVRGEFSNGLYRTMLSKGKTATTLFSAYLWSKPWGKQEWAELFDPEMYLGFRIKKRIAADGEVRIDMLDLISPDDLEVVVFGYDNPYLYLYAMLVPKIMRPASFGRLFGDWQNCNLTQQGRVALFERLLCLSFEPE